MSRRKRITPEQAEEQDRQLRQMQKEQRLAEPITRGELLQALEYVRATNEPGHDVLQSLIEVLQ